MRIRRFLHFLLFLVAVLLIWRVAETWRRPLEEYRTAARQGPTEEKPLPSSQVISPQTGKRFARIIADKDLFVPSRSRAQEEVKAPVVTVPPPSHLKLVGVVLTHGKEEAFFADATQGGKVVRLRTGESIGSYKLVSVAPLQATLTMGQEEGEEVSLPLLVLDSSTAGQAQQFLSQLRGDRSSLAVRQAARRFDGGAGENAPQTESHAIRQNIQQLQRRLRQIRRQAAREEGNEEETDTGEEEMGEEEEE